MPNNIPKEKQNGLWIPRWMCYLKDLSLAERDCYAFIYNLNENGNECYASRSYLAEYLMCSEDNISDITKKLEKKKYIIVKRTMIPNIDKNGEFINLKKQNIYCISGHMPGFKPPEGFKFKPAFCSSSFEDEINECGVLPLNNEDGKTPLPNEDGKTPLPSESGKTPHNNIVTNNNIIIDKKETSTKEILEKIEEENKEIKELKKCIHSKEIELEEAPNYTLRIQIKKQITVLKNKLKKLQPSQKKEKEYVGLPLDWRFIRIPINFNSFISKIENEKEKKILKTLIPLDNLTKKQYTFFQSCFWGYCSPKIVEKIKKLTEEEIIKEENKET
jgi:uncharacterized protein YlbG (UPF0298 family)